MGQSPNRVTDAVKIKKNRRLGEKFVIAFNKLLHTVRIHEQTNDLCVGVCEQFKIAAQALLEENGELTIESKHSRLFIQGDKLLYRPETSAVTFSMLDFFETIGIYGFSINDRLISTDVKNIYDLSCTLNTALRASDPKELGDRCLETGQYPWISVLFENQQRGQDDVDGKKEKSVRIYSHAYNSLKDVGKQISEKKHLSTSKAMRSLQDLLSIIYEDQNIVLGLSTIRDFDDYTYAHSVNVSILSMCLGKTIGLSRSSLMLLGMCSMFHDLGKIDLDVDVLNKPGKLTEDEFRQVQKHSLNSVRQIIRLDALRDVISKLILPPFEHHLKYDLSGYPQVSWRRPISLFGRIIAICDVYDALTTPRVYRPVAISPDRALGIMVENSGKDFDPILLKWFINMIGVYPVGTLVKLDTGEIGLVKQCDAKADLSRPPVLLLKGDGKGGFVAAKVIKLKSIESKAGGYIRNIVSTHHPSEMGIQPALYLS
jgi:HD-GYP domain-containing protein (c-di-GMP phosphodiesterase class II)